MTRGSCTARCPCFSGQARRHQESFLGAPLVWHSGSTPRGSASSSSRCGPPRRSRWRIACVCWTSGAPSSQPSCSGAGPRTSTGSRRARTVLRVGALLAAAILLLVFCAFRGCTRRDLVLLGLSLGSVLWSKPPGARRPRCGTWAGSYGARPCFALALCFPARRRRVAWLPGTFRTCYSSPRRNRGPVGAMCTISSSRTLPQALGLRLPVVLSSGSRSRRRLLLTRRSPPGSSSCSSEGPDHSAPPDRRRLPVFYFISPYTWLQSEPRYLTLVMPVFALLASIGADEAGELSQSSCAPLRSRAGFIELQRTTCAVRNRGRCSSGEPGPALDTLRSHHVGYAFASYWIACASRSSPISAFVGAEIELRPPLRARPAVYPGASVERSRTRPTFYLEAERHRDVAHVFVLAATSSLAYAGSPAHRLPAARQRELAIWLPPELDDERRRALRDARSRTRIHQEDSAPVLDAPVSAANGPTPGRQRSTERARRMGEACRRHERRAMPCTWGERTLLKATNA